MNRDDVLEAAPPPPGGLERALVTATRVAAVPFLLVTIVLVALIYAAAWLARPLGRVGALGWGLARRRGRVVTPR